MLRSHYCGAVTEKLLDQSVELAGWVKNRRDHGGVIFVDLRDREGVVQVVFQPEMAEVFAVAETIRNEYVLHIKGQVRRRPEGMVNTNIPSGQIEVVASELEILNAAQTPPFFPDDHQTVGEDIRLRHRYIDLRREEMQKRFILRDKVTQVMRTS